MRTLTNFAAICLLSAGAAAAQAEQPSHPDGFWKVHPPQDVHAEFGGEDPLGLSVHQHIPTDCSIVWKDPSEGKAYCFSTPMSALTFQDDEASMLPKARTFWDAAHAHEQDAQKDGRALK